MSEIMNEFSRHNGIRKVYDRMDHACTEVTFDATLTNNYGYFHGGVYFSLSDAAAGVAARSNGQNYVTLNASFNYHKAIKSGTIKAESTVISRTHKICVVDVKVFDDQRTVVASGTFTMYKIQ